MFRGLYFGTWKFKLAYLFILLSRADWKQCYLSLQKIGGGDFHIAVHLNGVLEDSLTSNCKTMADLEYCH